MLIVGAEVDGTGPIDVRVRSGRIADIGRRLAPRPDESRIDAAGAALLPGLHDHHLHLFALAAAEHSVPCGPPDVRDATQLAEALARADSRTTWVRGTRYHESVAGELDRTRLDQLVRDRPLRIQHRSGALWMLNSPGVERLGLDRGADAAGVERGPDGRATGRLFRMDAWLRERTDSSGPPDLGRVSRRLAGLGVTGVTDATVTNDAGELRAFVRASDAGELRQRAVIMGSAALPGVRHDRVTRGPFKIVLDENDLPAFDALRDSISEAHRSLRAVAIHCVTRAELVLAAAAVAAAGTRAGDRIEHAGVAPPDSLATLREAQLTVVTQPNFIRERGDEYRREVAPSDQPWLYRAAGLIAASIPVGGGTDAPFGDPNPWLAAQAAVDRTSRTGEILGPDERLTPERAIALFTSHSDQPGAPPRRIAIGAAADLCLLDRPWSEARNDLAAVRVVTAICDGEVIA